MSARGRCIPGAGSSCNADGSTDVDGVGHGVRVVHFSGTGRRLAKRRYSVRYLQSGLHFVSHAEWRATIRNVIRQRASRRLEGPYVLSPVFEPLIKQWKGNLVVSNWTPIPHPSSFSGRLGVIGKLRSRGSSPSIVRLSLDGKLVVAVVPAKSFTIGGETLTWKILGYDLLERSSFEITDCDREVTSVAFVPGTQHSEILVTIKNSLPEHHQCSSAPSQSRSLKNVNNLKCSVFDAKGKFVFVAEEQGGRDPEHKRANCFDAYQRSLR